MVSFLYVIWNGIVLWSSWKTVMRYGIFVVVEPHGLLSFFYVSSS